MAIRPPVYQPTPSQYASAASHLEQRSAWRTVRIDNVRYVVLSSGNSGRVYHVRADAAGCGCCWYERTLSQCSHMLAVYLAATEDELFEEYVNATLGAPAPRKSYEALYPSCKSGCGDVSDTRDGYCDRCASDREWQARRDHQHVAAGA